jgi:hypothetical protein
VKTKIFFIKLVIFVLSLWIASQVLTRTLDRAFVKDRSQKELWTLSQHDLSMGYVVAGDSRAFNTIDTRTLEIRTGQPSINVGFGGQGTIETYLTLYLFLQHENHVRNVILQIDGADLDDSLKFQTYLYMPYLADPEVAATVRDVLGSKRYAVLKAFPLAKYWEYNNFYGLERLQNARSGSSPYDQSAGSELLYDESYHVFPGTPSDPSFVVDARSLRYLDRIVQLTHSRGVNLTMFSSPVYHHNGMFLKYDETFRSYIARYCQERGIPYLDFSDAKFDPGEFRDYGHLNGRGALRFTAILGDSLLTLSNDRSSGAGK